MRWSGQQVLDDGIGAETALPGLRGLLRSVRTPEFAGTVFHEVEAKSALNRVPGSSPVPFRWTVNPYRGCAHACVYCVHGSTRVLMADGCSRPIAEIRVGDIVVGTEWVGGRRTYVRTTVLAHWSTTKPAHLVRLAGGTEIIASGEHRFLTDDGWRHVSGGWCRSGRRRRLRVGAQLVGPGPEAVGGPQGGRPPRSTAYRRGYLCGVIRADGLGETGPGVSWGAEPAGSTSFPSERLDLEALGRAHHFLAHAAQDHPPADTGEHRAGSDRAGSDWAEPGGRAMSVAVGAPHVGRIAWPGGARLPTGAAPTGARRRAIGAAQPDAGLGAAPIGEVIQWPWQPGQDWCAGFLAGVIDASGTTVAGEIRIGGLDGRVRDSRPSDGGGDGGHGAAVGLEAGRLAVEEMIGRVTGALHRLGFRFEVAVVAGVRAVRVLGGTAAFLRLLRVVDPAVGRLRDLSGAAVDGGPELEVVAVRSLGTDTPMYDITTGTGDFIAEGVVSHNCFARNTHTYLDLDAGADFDSQIVVKVNIARVLDHELRAARWAREPVAMGTNTDPYQRAEGRYRLMPGVIRALARSGTPFSLLTKGTVLARDLPEITAAAADVPVGLGVSIALTDRALQARLEPGTPSPAARLDLVRRITDAGLPCGVMVAPVLPLLTDSTDALDELLARIAAAGATGASVLALHLRRGTREWFLAWLAREHPGLVEAYGRLYSRGAYVDPEYRRALGDRVAPLLRRHGLAGGVSTLRDQVGGAAAGRPPAGEPASEQLSLL